MNETPSTDEDRLGQGEADDAFNHGGAAGRTCRAIRRVEWLQVQSTVGHHFVPRSRPETIATRSLPEAMPVTVLRVYLHEGAQRVFVRTAPAQYTRKTVTGIASGNDRVAIVSGLKQGDEVVTDGALYLQQLLDTANRPDK